MMKKKNRTRRFVALFLSIVFVMTLSLPAFASEAESFECQNGNGIVVDEFRVISFDDYIISEQIPDGVYIYSDDASDQTEMQTEDYGETARFWSASEEVDEFQITHASKDVTPHGIVHTFQLSIPGDGVYYEIPAFKSYYEQGAMVTVSGTWEPPYAGISVRFADVVYGGSTELHDILSCEPKSFGLWRDSTWAMYVRSSGLNVIGTIQITVI